MKNLKYFLLINLILMFTSCGGQPQNLLGDDIRLFEGKAWELAKAVEHEDTVSIKETIKKGEIPVNFQEAKFGQSLLHWAVMANRAYSVKALLEGGADPNLQDTYDGKTPVMLASDYGPNYDTTSNILRLLLKYGGNANLEEKISRRNQNTTRKTPLIIAASCCLEKTKLLVEAGADINYTNEFHQSPLRSAIEGGKDAVYITKYLLIEKGAVIPASFGKTLDGDSIKITNLLRTWVFPLDSKEYKIKMGIVSFLKQKGIDYWSETIPQNYYKNYSKEYLEKY